MRRNKLAKPAIAVAAVATRSSGQSSRPPRAPAWDGSRETSRSAPRRSKSTSA